MPARKSLESGAADRAAPWWRFGIVWLALSGPAAVVVAGLATMAIAFHGADQAVPEPTVPVVRTLDPATRTTAPALQVRNHAATPSR